MHKFILSLLSLFIVSTAAVADSQQWTISVTPNGTAGGYIETTSGQSVDNVPYSTYWPESGYVPVFYVHHPKGSFSITSANVAALRISITDMTTGKQLLSNAAATSFAFTAPQEGWYRWALSGGTPDVTQLHDFTVTATSALSGNNTGVWLAGWRSVPSLHLNGFGSTNEQMPSGNAFDWAYDEVLMPEDADFYGTYIESLAASGWYLGLQNNGGNGATTRRTLIFSAWDAGDTDSDPTLADFKRSGVVAHGSADEVTAERFGGEGTGSHIILNGNLWLPGRWVRFLVGSRPEQITLSDGTTYNNTLLSAWRLAEGIDTEWQYIGSLRQAGRINYINPSNAFLEEFTRYNNSQGNAPHKAYYRRIFTRSMQSGKWYNRNSFWWSHTDGGTADGNRNDTYQTAVDDYDGEPAMYMQSGGYLYNTTQTGPTVIPYLEPDGIVPDDATLQALLDRDIAPALQAQEQERMQIAVTKALTKLANTGWTVQAFSSEETYGEGSNGRASMAVDGDASTYWHTSWAYSQSSYPHSLTLLHDGDITIDQITLDLPSGRSTDYSAKTVRLSSSTDGVRWTTVGTYSLPASSSQTIKLASSLTTSRLKFDFTEGNGQRYLVVGEIGFYQTNLSSLRTLAQSYLDNVDTFNGYDSSDYLTGQLLSTIRTQLSSSSLTASELSASLADLAARGRIIKYGEVTEVASLSADKAYYISNAVGYGALVVADDEAIPTLRNASPLATSGHAADCLPAYRQAVPVQDANSNWRILTSDEYPGHYYIYNIGVRQYLNPGYHSTLSTTPVPVSISRSGSYFVITAQATSYEGHSQLCAAPQFAESSGSPISMWDNDDGGRWIIYDNYSLTPDLTASLTAQLRRTATTESHRIDYASQGVVITLPDSYTTFASDRALDFGRAADVAAYAATDATASGSYSLLSLTPVAAVPAKTGLILKGEAGDHEVPYAATTPAAIGSNMLVGVTSSTAIAPTYSAKTNYILLNGIHGMGFYPLTSGGTLAAGKAYLSIPTSSAYGIEAFILSPEGITVGVGTTPSEPTSTPIVCDLQGRRVAATEANQLRRGVYVVAGRKVVVR